MKKQLFHFRTLFILLTALNLFPSLVQAQKLTAMQKQADFNQLVQMIRSKYGPLHFKADQMGITLENLIAQYEEKLVKNSSNQEFYYGMLQFVAAFQDGHFNAYVPTERKASVPFSVKWIQGKVLIDHIDRDKLTESDFPFVKGDEILSVDGVKINDFINEFATYKARGNDLSSKAVAAYHVTSRNGKVVPVPEADKVSFEIKRGTSSITKHIELEWTKEGEALDEAENLKYISFPSVSSRYAQMQNLSIKSDFEDTLLQYIDESYHCSGSSRIHRPKDATVILEKPFVAYYHPTQMGNIGMLRIPHYYPRNEHTQEGEFELRWQQYEYAISELEKNTVGLIIDQDHNCGGSVEYLERMAGLFLKDNYSPLKFSFLSTKSEILSFRKMAKSKDMKNTLKAQQLEGVIDLMIKHWKEGDRMTPMTSFRGNDYLLAPNQTRYTKPIVMMIDFMSGSGGDAFPAMLKGHGRAKLIGTRTMGLGGHVVGMPTLNNSGIELRMTKSLFFHPDGRPIENFGVQPDINYEITRDDFLYEFQEYHQKALTEVFKMIDA